MISKDTISKINEEADVVEVLSDFISLKRSGSNYKANCPFHQEKTPSFMVSPSKQIYKCFGCGKAGDSVKFIMDHEALNYVEALRYLANKYNIEIEESKQNPEYAEQQSKKEALYIANEYAKNYYENYLNTSERGQNIGLPYFRERGFNEDTIKTFQLGYAPNEKSEFSKKALDDGYQAEILKAAGLTTEKNEQVFDFFRDRIIFPIHSISGKIMGFGGRILKKNIKAPKYINTSQTDIYDKSKVLYGMYFSKNDIRNKDECLLVEGYTDVISMHQNNIKNVVASSGTSLTIDQVKLIKRYTQNICIIYDGDLAGIKAALRGIDIILENGLHVKVLLLPDGEDPDSFIQKKGTAYFNTFLKDNQEDFILFKSNLLL